MRLIACFCLILALVACDIPAKSPLFHADTNPKTLSEWGLFTVGHQTLTLNDGVIPYHLNTPLFTDYALKLRTIWMPEGVSATYKKNEVFDLPVGTILSKTFYYQRADENTDTVRKTASRPTIYTQDGLDTSDLRMVETRLLVHRVTGWQGLAYIWNADQTEATLKRTGAVIPLDLERDNGAIERFRYIVPNVTQCAGCHAFNVETRKLRPIGLQARHINLDYPYTSEMKNQLLHLATINYLQAFDDSVPAPRHANWADETAPLEDRMRAYLDINCAHCHNLKGPAGTSGLYLDPTTPIAGNFGLCKLPIAAGAGTGGRRFGITPGEPEASIFLFRMESNNPAVMMPELGRSLVHEEGVALIRDWIDQLDGSCR